MQVYRTPILTLDPNAQAGGGMVEVVKLADAQATVEALRAQLESANTLLHKKNCAIGKAETTIDALQRERDHAKKMAAVQKEVADNQTWHVRELTAALDTERERNAQLQALVRALPVPEEGGFPIVEVDGDYYVNHTSRFSTKAEADAYTGLLIYRATLDATTPATTKT